MTDTMGEDPLDSTIPEQQDDTEPAGEDASNDTEEKERMTMHIPESLAERIRNAVYWTPGLTISDVATKGLNRIMDELEEENGGEFPDREQELSGGRPLK
jgi:hypothetical protein